MKLMLKKISSISTWWIVALLLLASSSLMLRSARTESAIMDELAHIPAGYGYVHNFDYRLNPEHPPLVKALAMLPVLFLDPHFPTESDAWRKQINSQWDMGSKFLYGSGNDADAIVQTARIFPIILTLLLIILTYLLARSILGPWWALLAAALAAFSPTLLAHGHYVTTDVGAALGIVLATYFFLKYLESPTRKHLWFAGLSFGVAQVMKFSTPFLVPLFILVMFALWLRDVIVKSGGVPFGRLFKIALMKGLSRVWRLVLIFAIGYIFVVYPVYFIFTAHYPIERQLADTTQILGSFAGGPAHAGESCKAMRCLADFDIWMSGNPVFRPFAEYLLGLLMVIQRVDGGNTIYFLGAVSQSGGWIYFPLLFLIKEPLPTVIFVVVGLALALFWMLRGEQNGRGRWRRISDYIALNLPEFTMGLFVVFYWTYSIRSDLNIGVRHLIPTLPFIFILTAGVWKKWVTKISIARPDISSIAGSIMRSIAKYILVVLLVVWLFFEAISVAPHFLSYFNQLGGGMQNGYRFVTDSNYDWGQDLTELRTWVNAHPEVDKIAVDYFGGGSPAYYLGNKEVNWWSSRGNPANENIHWLAVSVNTLEGAIQPLKNGQTRGVFDGYEWLTTLRPPATSTTLLGALLGNAQMGNVPTPDARAGTSIFIYHL